MEEYLGFSMATVILGVPALPAVGALVAQARPICAGHHGVRVEVADRLEVNYVVRP